MKFLITGASGGIGREIAIVLAEKNRGCELVLCARNGEALAALSRELEAKFGARCTVFALDLSREENCRELYAKTKNSGIDAVVNNAGFGVFGEFADTATDAELNMLDLNVRALQMLTKFFLREFLARDTKAYILNVSSMAGFFAGPRFSTYYASKNYVTRLTEGIREELRRKRSQVSISLLCPGPVRTGFGERAGVSFWLAGTPVRAVAEAAVKGMFAGKLYIVPGISNKILRALGAIVPSWIAARIAFSLQNGRVATKTATKN
ncbi:MAG: SDR family NAD(P)-dependent oxidoreductase [Opitutae bacterium]|nr:SDR family NAD(P)-dependent oxidoreductase [Opitutae bacterium]